MRTVDAVSGRETDVPKRVEGDVTILDGARVFTSDRAVQADGRVYEVGQLPQAAATATQVASKIETGVAVHDRRSGARVVAFDGDDATVSAAGERLVITAKGRDHLVAATLAPSRE